MISLSFLMGGHLLTCDGPVNKHIIIIRWKDEMQLGFKEVEELFAARYGIELPSVPFRGRLQHLQRNEFPHDKVRPGKGRKVLYDWAEIFQLSVALDLIDVGLTPETATSLVRKNRTLVLLAASTPGSRLKAERLLQAVRESACPFSETVFIVTAAHALFAYGAREPKIEATLSICSGKDLIESFKGDNPYEASWTYIDLGKRVMLTLRDIGDVIKSGALDETVADYESWAGKYVLNP